MQQLHQQQQLRSIFDVASQLENLGGSNAAALKRIFRITSAQAKCVVGPELSAKYKVEQDNQQHVVSVTNMHSLEQTWYNQARTTKPQTFKHSAAAGIDPTGNGVNCDFCSWQTLTAKDPGFGRIHLPHAVTGSNLFKYAEPSHGIVLFRHHNPLQFSQAALCDLLDASWLWFQESHKLNPHAAHPFLLWNCLPRAGASQYHGHAQVMLSSVSVPGVDKLQRAASNYQQQHPGCCYYSDLLKAHAAVGLVRQVSIAAHPAGPANGNTGSQQSSGREQHSQLQQQQEQQQQEQGQQQQQELLHPQAQQQDRQQYVAWSYASLAPVKDQEVVVMGRHLCCPAFQRMLHAALRGLIDGLGSVTFNLGVLNMDVAIPAPAGVGFGRSFWPSQDSVLEAIQPGAERDSGSSTSSSSNGYRQEWSDGVLQMAVSSSYEGHYIYGGSADSSSGALWLPDADYWAGQRPVIARLCSRGKLSSAGSDFGGLEVFGGGSIGHTDPFNVVQQLDTQLAAGVEECVDDDRVTAN